MTQKHWKNVEENTKRLKNWDLFVSYRHLKSCKHVKPLLGLYQQNLPPANEIMAPLAFTAREIISQEFQDNNSITVTFSLFELQCVFTK